MDRVEGKTKIITPLWGFRSVVGVFEAKDDITAGNGTRHEHMAGKAELITSMTCKVFEVLEREGYKTAYIGPDGPKTFLAKLCTMIPVEVVVRRVATGSYLKRHSNVPEGTQFDFPLIEYYLKTNHKKANLTLTGETELPCDDPLMLFHEDEIPLHHPAKAKNSFLGTLADQELKQLIFRHREVISHQALSIFHCVERYWKSVGGVLQDFKLEFGILPDGTLVLADELNCDHWRVVWNDYQLSKQLFRDGYGLDTVLSVYRIANALVSRW